MFSTKDIIIVIMIILCILMIAWYGNHEDVVGVLTWIIITILGMFIVINSDNNSKGGLA